MNTIRIGDLEVNRLGLGTNRIADNPEAKALLHEAVDLGVNFIDTAHVYTGGESERTIGSALAPFPPHLVVATKGGMGEAGAGRAEHLRANLEESLNRLNTDCIQLYQLHRVDATVPLEESIAALKTFQKEGRIRHIGLSEVTVEQLERARKIAPIASVQNQYNLTYRTYEGVLDYCTEHGIAFIPWFPLGGRRNQGGDLEKRLEETAGRYDATPHQLALAWLLKRSPIMLPIPGTLSPDHLRANVAAGAIELSDADFTALSQTAS